MSETLTKDKRIPIPFHIHPYKFEEGMHAVEKADSQGSKKRYLRGITSGLKLDGHGERMTKSCIDKMQNQAQSGNILLYEGQHGVTYTEDIGKLVDSEITPTGEWITTYRLYDESDGFEKGSSTLEKADKLWRQVNGLHPYVDTEGNPKPIQKGFSIEGFIPEGGIVSMSESGQRVIDGVDLDGVLVTPRPSYSDSVITSIYKALDELTPAKRINISENIRGKFINKIEDENRKNSYYSKRFKLEDALTESIEEIMNNGSQVRDRLNLLFDEYKNMMIELLISHAGVFIRPINQQDLPDNPGGVDVAKMQRRTRVLKNIQDQLKVLVDERSRVEKSKAKKEKKYGRRNSTKRTFPRGKANN